MERRTSRSIELDVEFEDPLEKQYNGPQYAIPYHRAGFLYDRLAKYDYVQGVKSFVRSTLRFMVPLPLQSKADRSSTSTAGHALAHLNGMRGFAAFIVFIRHISFQTFNLGPQFGYEFFGREVSTWERFAALPIIRLFFSGRGALSIFFVLSGYVLSRQPLKAIRAEQPDSLGKFAKTLTSYTFKRPFRLFLPCLASTFLSMNEVYFGLWENARRVTEEGLLGGEPMSYPPRLASYFSQINDWSHAFWEFCFVWRSKYTLNTFHYDLALWTIPLEMRCSLFVFATLLATAKLKPVARISLIMLLIVRSIDWVRWDMMCYWAGMILAELDLIKEERYERLGIEQPHHSKRWKLFWFLQAMSGMWLLSYPESRGDLQWGYRWLSHFIPSSYQNLEDGYWWPAIGVIQSVWAANNSPFVRIAWNSKLLQYLGIISFPLYLMHWPFITSFTFNILPIWLKLSGNDVHTPAFFVGWFFIAVASMLGLVWVADMFWRGIDVPCGNFVRWLENKLINPVYSY